MLDFAMLSRGGAVFAEGCILLSTCMAMVAGGQACMPSQTHASLLGYLCSRSAERAARAKTAGGEGLLSHLPCWLMLACLVRWASWALRVWSCAARTRDCPRRLLASCLLCHAWLLVEPSRRCDCELRAAACLLACSLAPSLARRRAGYAMCSRGYASACLLC